MEDHPTPKSLSHDEKKAADAAFAGRPFNPAWSSQARRIYDGIVKALPQPDPPVAPEIESTSPGADPLPSPTKVEASRETAHEVQASPAEEDHTHDFATFLDRKDAIQAGVLIDVTPTAKGLGITFPIAVTKPLWNIGIAADQAVTEEERAGRLRDVLMAFRLRLSSLVTVSPLIDFPALLSMPPNSVPQPIPLFALIQPDEEHRATVTLLLPNEVATSIIPMN